MGYYDYGIYPIYIEERAKAVSKYIVDTQCTIQECAKKFGVSSSTIQKDVSIRIKKIDENLWKKVRKVIENNKLEAHLRGGLATAEKYYDMQLEKELR